MNRGGITPAPQNAVSYNNPTVYASDRYNVIASGESLLAIACCIGAGGTTYPPPPSFMGLFPLRTATLIVIV